MRKELIGSEKGSRAVVVGAGKSGRDAARLLHELGADVNLLEVMPKNVSVELQDECKDKGIALLTGPHKPEYFAGASRIVLSPGIPVGKIRECLPEGCTAELISELELAGRYATGKVLAITGTNGKTTTTSLSAHILREAGFRVFEGGNIGTPLSSYVLGDDEADVLVLEVSSFQAQNCTSFAPEVGVFLNLSVDHQDYHRDMQEYLDAKLNLFAHMSEDSFVILPEEMRSQLAEQPFTKAHRIYFESTDRFESELLPGEHNQCNMEAAFQALSRFGVSEREMRNALETYVPHPHRLERVGEKQGILFVNDSKATTLASVKAALEAFDRPILLLAGGKYKGGDLESLAPLIKRKVRALGLFGASRERFESAWEGLATMHWEPELGGAVRWLMTQAQEGDVMLLSPGTASFDLYDNYGQRGEHFRTLFQEL